MRGTIHLILFSLLTALSVFLNFFHFIESREDTIMEFFFCYLSQWECIKKYICYTLPFTALQVNPTMTTSTAEKPWKCEKGSFPIGVDTNIVSQLCEWAFIIHNIIYLIEQLIEK